MLRLLLEHSADPNGTNQKEAYGIGIGIATIGTLTPLMVAARLGNANAVHMLLAAGADTSIERRAVDRQMRPNEKMSMALTNALDLAQASGSAECVAMLRDARTPSKRRRKGGGGRRARRADLIGDSSDSDPGDASEGKKRKRERIEASRHHPTRATSRCIASHPIPSDPTPPRPAPIASLPPSHLAPCASCPISCCRRRSFLSFSSVKRAVTPTSTKHASVSSSWA